MYYFTLTLDQSSPFSFVVEAQSLNQPITAELLEKIQETITCLAEIVLAENDFQCSYLPEVFMTCHPNAKTFLDLVNCVVQPLLKLSQLSSTYRKDLSCIQEMITILQQNPMLSPSVTSNMLPIPALSSEASSMPFWYQEPSSSELSQNFPQDTSTLVPFLVRSTEKAIPAPQSSSTSYIVQKTPDTPQSPDIFHDNFLASLALDMDFWAPNSPIALPSATMSSPSTSIPIHPSVMPILTAPIASSENIIASDEESEAPSSPLRAISPLYDPTTLPTLQMPEPGDHTTTKKTLQEATSSSISINNPAPSLQTTQKKRFNTTDLFEQSSPLFAKLVDQSLDSLSSLQVQHFLLPIWDLTTGKQTQFTFKDVITLSGDHFLKHLSPWPSDILSKKNYGSLLSVSFYNKSKKLVICKKNLLFSSGARGSYHSSLHTALLSSLGYTDIDLIMPSQPKTLHTDVSHTDLILLLPTGMNNIHYKTLQLLYIYKILKDLLLNPLIPGSFDPPPHQNHRLMVQLDKYINFFQQQAQKIFDRAVALDPKFPSRSLIQPTADSYHLFEKIPSCKRSSSNTDISSKQEPQPKKSKKENAQISLAEAFSIHPHQPIPLKTLKPLLQSQEELKKLLPKHCLPEKGPVVNISSLTLIVHTQASKRKFQLINTSHLCTYNAWFQFFNRFFSNLTTMIKEPLTPDFPFSNYILSPYLSTEPLYRILQAFFMLKMMKLQLNSFSLLEELSIPQTCITQMSIWQHNIFIYLQKYSCLIDPSFYEINNPIPTSKSTTFLNYNNVFNLTKEDINNISWPTTNFPKNNLEFISIERSFAYLTPVFLTKKTTIKKTELTDYLRYIYAAVDMLTDDTTCPLQTIDHDLNLQKPDYASQQTHFYMQALFFLKLHHQKALQFWPSRQALLNEKLHEKIEALTTKCHQLIQRDKQNQ